MTSTAALINRQQGLSALALAEVAALSGDGPWMRWIHGTGELCEPIGWGKGSYFTEEPGRRYDRVSRDEVLMALAFVYTLGMEGK